MINTVAANQLLSCQLLLETLVTGRISFKMLEGHSGGSSSLSNEFGQVLPLMLDVIAHAL